MHGLSLVAASRGKWKWKSLSPVRLFESLWNSPGQILEWSPALQAESLPAEPPGKPKNTGMGNLSLLQRIFPTQESNWGLLHCRRILYQLSYQGRPNMTTREVLKCALLKSCPRDSSYLGLKGKSQGYMCARRGGWLMWEHGCSEGLFLKTLFKRRGREGEKERDRQTDRQVHCFRFQQRWKIQSKN